MQDGFIRSRRQFVSGSALALGALATSASKLAAQTNVHDTEMTTHVPTADTILKFNPNGTRRSFLGNTVICHLQPQGSTRDAVEALAADLKGSNCSAKVALLPAASYHMTVYPGVNDQARNVTGWPADIPGDATIQECSRIIGERMRQFRLQCTLPIRMKIDQPKTLANLRASTLRMVGADPEEELKIRKVRDRLVDVFNFRDNKHDEYGFHITLAYQLQQFTPLEQEAYQALLAKHVPLIMSLAPTFEFANPEFCTFTDMFRFDVHTLLAT